MALSIRYVVGIDPVIGCTALLKIHHLVTEPGDRQELHRRTQFALDARAEELGVADIVEAGELYGVRRPGTDAVYELPETSRNDSLAAIAERTREDPDE